MKKIHFLLFIFFPILLISQKYNIKFSRISIEEGLSQSTVYSIFQDYKGYMWIGTEDGLNKYDGYSFKIYRKDNGLSHNRITSIFEENDGIIWIGTLFGLNKINTFSNSIKQYIFNKNLDGKNEISSIIKDKEDNLWIGTDNGIYFYNKRKNTFTPNLYNKNINKLIKNKNIFKLYKDKSGNIWIGTLNGLYKTNIKNQKFNLVKYKNISGNYILSIGEDSKDIWIGTTNGLNRIDKKENIEKYFFNSKNKNSLSNNFITSILVDKKNGVWIGTINGLNKYNRKKNNFNHYKHNHNDPYSISDNSILSIHEDSFGIVWIGTNLGLSKFDNNKINFIHYHKNNNNLSNNNILSIYESDSASIWIGTEFGLNKFNKKEGNFKQYFTNENKKQYFENSGITSIAEDIKKQLWLGTSENGIKVFNPKTNQLDHYYNNKDNKSLSSNYIKFILIDKKKIWIGTDSGLNRYLGSGKFKNYIFKDSDNIKNNISVETILKDSYGNLWIGTNGEGLFRITKKDRFVSYKSGLKNYNDKIVLCMIEDKKKRIWLGTKGGLKLLDREKGLIHFREKHGLPNDDIKAIVEDKNDLLWISTNRGLSRFNSETGTFKNYFLKDGLQGNKFNQNSALFSKNSKIYFGGINGFSVFNPDKISINTHPPKIILTSFKKFNKEFKLKHHISKIEEIKLSHKDRLISFKFVGLNYSSPSENRYSWKLEGLNENWINLGKKRDITITNLTSGSYILKIKASNCDNVWTKKGKEVKLYIPTPFYQTIWFYILILIFLLFLFYLIYRIKLNAIQRQKEKLETLVKEKTAQLLEANKKLSILAKEDGLTKLLNKRSFIDQLESTCNIAKREQRLISIVMLDIDYFKIYNDTLGHQAGDNCLKIIADILKSTLKRPGDVAARYGGEEFIILLENTDLEGAIHITKKIKENIKNKNIIFENTKVPNLKRVTSSFGICTFQPNEKYTTHILILAADTALYQAKINGRDTIFVFNTDETI